MQEVSIVPCTAQVKKQEDVHPKKKIMSMKMPMIFIMIIWTNMRIMMMLRMIGVIIEYPSFDGKRSIHPLPVPGSTYQENEK